MYMTKSALRVERKAPKALKERKSFRQPKGTIRHTARRRGGRDVTGFKDIKLVPGRA